MSQNQTQNQTRTADVQVLENAELVPRYHPAAPPMGYGAGRPLPPEPYGIFPRFTTVAGGIDSVASRIPWWVWVGGTLAAVWYFQGRGRKVRLISE